MDANARTTRRKLSVDESVALIESFYTEHGRLPRRGEKSSSGLDVGNRLQYMRRRFANLPKEHQTRLSCIGVEPSSSHYEHIVKNLSALAFEIRTRGFTEATKTSAMSERAPSRHIGRFLIGLKTRLTAVWDTHEAHRILTLMQETALITYVRDTNGRLVLRPAPNAVFVSEASDLIGATVEIMQSDSSSIVGLISDKTSHGDDMCWVSLIDGENERLVSAHPEALMKMLEDGSDSQFMV